VANKTAVCGTRSAYNRHLRNKEKACELCLDANRKHTKKIRLLFPEKIAERKKQYQQENKDKLNLYSRNRYASIPEKIRTAKKRAYYQKIKSRYQEINRASARKRRTLKFNNEVDIYTEQDILRIYGDICYLCNTKINLKANRKIGQENWQNGLHIDHLIPISKNGSDTIDNVRPTHALCNVKKHDKELIYGFSN
jgi:5-methylcytosine-specific restriction endonuclease McrA